MDVDNLTWSIEFYESNISKCNELIHSMDNLNTIPLVCDENFHNFKDGDLVRYQGMVQDMLNPEYYYATYKVLNSSNGAAIVKSGKYRDIAPCQENEELKFDGEVPEERLVFFCIPIPGVSTWAQNHLKMLNRTQNPCPSSSIKKRTIDEEDEEILLKEGVSSGSHIIKKVFDDSNDISVSKNERHCNDKYFPLNESKGLSCIVKIYETEDSCNIVLNDRIEVVGFLSLNPALEGNWEGCDAEDKALHPPPSLVPRIHCIFARKLIHNNPLLNQNINPNEVLASAETVRSDLHLILTQILFGDDLAADYLICHLLSRVYSRGDGQALGKFSLNLSNMKPGSYGRRLYSVLESIVTSSQFIPLTIDTLNERLFVPRKDYDSNRLWSGRLQVCEDTNFVLDETEMNEGKLEHIGCLNIAALQNVIRDQEVSYDFSYYTVKYNANFPVLVLSEGKSMFETDIQVKLKPDPSASKTIDETIDAAVFFLNDERSERIRKYLTCLRLQDFEMSKELTERIGQDYVTLRQQKNGVSSTDLHNLLVLSRLLALSHGRTSLTLEDWSRGLQMESERRNRIS